MLILADGYPKETTPVDATIFQQAAAKKLRLYVEYPAVLPNVALGKPAYLKTGEYGANVERTVVASDAFGPDLKQMRIMMINDCHYLPAEATNPHLVLARVEGYDTAVYGLPKDVHPILFAHPRGDILVATTKLSQFVTGRYAPTEAWGPVWRMILGWLQPGKTPPTLTWTPTVRPSFSKSEPLPPDAQDRAIRRGIEYYGKSRLYIHPSWPKDTGIDPIPDAWPVGDGTYGIGECYISKRIFFDGTQAVSRSGVPTVILKPQWGWPVARLGWVNRNTGKRHENSATWCSSSRTSAKVLVPIRKALPTACSAGIPIQRAIGATTTPAGY